MKITDIFRKKEPKWEGPTLLDKIKLWLDENGYVHYVEYPARGCGDLGFGDPDFTVIDSQSKVIVRIEKWRKAKELFHKVHIGYVEIGSNLENSDSLVRQRFTENRINPYFYAGKLEDINSLEEFIEILENYKRVKLELEEEDNSDLGFWPIENLKPLDPRLLKAIAHLPRVRKIISNAHSFTPEGIKTGFISQEDKPVIEALAQFIFEFVKEIRSLRLRLQQYLGECTVHTISRENESPRIAINLDNLHIDLSISYEERCFYLEYPTKDMSIESKAFSFESLIKDDRLDISPITNFISSQI